MSWKHSRLHKNLASQAATRTWMATVRLAADKATLDVSWTNYFTECKSKGRAYFKGKIQTGGQGRDTGGSCPPPLAPPMIQVPGYKGAGIY